MTTLLAIGLFTLLLAMGVPIAFTLGLTAAALLLLAVPALPAVTTLAQRFATGLDSFALLAIPLFILSGQLMSRGGAARRLVDFGRALLGGLPGGLLHVNVLACLLFGAISGSAVAAAAAIGTFLIPLMERDGYERELGAAVNVAASTTGLLVPPSNILIVYSLASGGASIAALFLAGYIPGVLVALLVSVVAAVMARRQGVERERSDAGVVWQTFWQAVPSLLLIFIVMGGIVAGIFTATEAAAVAVAWAALLSVVLYREVELRDLPSILLEAATTTGIVMMLIGASMGLSWALAFESVPQRLTEWLLSLSSTPLATLALINLALLVVGTVMDITPAVLIFTPILLPVVTELGMDPVHFGIVMVLNLCIGLCTPPVGTVLFVGASTARVRLEKMVPKLVPLWLAMVIALGLVTAFPGLSLWLPRKLGF